MRRWLPILLVPLLLLMAAWDTRVIKGDIWRSTYFAGKSDSVPEHTTLASLALQELGVGDLFGQNGTANVSLVDLNATVFREEQLLLTPREGDDQATKVEERLLPPPARFAGLPDYSYGPADWLNKNRTCPIGGPAGDDARCHEFMGWLGGLNSVHFGSQATRMYAHYHRLALQRAGRARQLREQMSPEERVAYSRALRESEHQALMYEGYAQHFLQDRWAIGHMWERWDGPDRTQVTYESVWGSVVIGAVSGLIHGAEAEFNKWYMKGTEISADPMSSPLRGETAARPMLFRHAGSPDAPPVPAIGDERLADMMRGAFGKGYGRGNTDQPLDVVRQRSEMLTCSKAGWAEVIRALGPGTGGGYGDYGARLAADAPDFDIIDRESCWDMWATNRSVYVGLVGESGLGFAALAALGLTRQAATGAAMNPADEAIFSSVDLGAKAWTLWRRQWLDPDGTDLARGGIGPLFGAPTGDKARLPIYAEPVDPSNLPEKAPGGVDRQTVFGAMSLAHSDYWSGENGLALLDRLRGSDEPRLQQACQFVADMAWQGTHPVYAGRMSRSRMASGRPVRSLGQIRNGPREAATDDPRDPYYIDQGYVSRTEADDPTPTFGSRAAANWCARTPVIRLSRDAELRNQNIIQTLAPDAARVDLIGQDFGARRGRVLLTEVGGRQTRRGRVIDWDDNRIQINFRPGDLKDGQDYRVEIRPADGPRSVGLFILRIRPGEADVAEAEIPVVQGCDGPPPPVPAFDVRASLVRQLGPDPHRADPKTLARALENTRNELAAAQQPLRAFMVKEQACLRQRQVGGMVFVERVTREGHRFAERARAADVASRPPSSNGVQYQSIWTKHCATARSGGPIDYTDLLYVGGVSGGDAFKQPGDFWAAYVRELDGVIQYGRFAETFLAAWVMALDRPGPPTAPDVSLAREGFDLRITDPAAVVGRYFRPIPAARDGRGGGNGVNPRDPQNWNLRAIGQTRQWASSALALYEGTVRGVVDRREYEAWLTTRLRGESEDPLLALCRVRDSLAKPTVGVGFFIISPVGDGPYRAADGRPYPRIGWPWLYQGRSPYRVATPAPGPVSSAPAGSLPPISLPERPEGLGLPPPPVPGGRLAPD